jgi:aspartate oxidase
MKGLPAETDFVVIGAGVAGLRSAIELANAGRVLVLAKEKDFNSDPAQGSIAAELSRPQSKPRALLPPPPASPKLAL